MYFQPCHGGHRTDAEQGQHKEQGLIRLGYRNIVLLRS